ncbi:hypothetical protein K5V21_18685 [Clostridium sardiniense]|uniref:Uncharacterized protein n=1 Tax=Clostridium sardiniense TaxID=29369 RepID=A0ABS7L335_CLOSR|nr:hypothetical protein [Clostridium sardiniense]MBY0757444.1 hypothetical protein [Clostridium sardiniense]MDQ0462189.1 hypothetical protein [Clostridium sardiniense]
MENQEQNNSQEQEQQEIDYKAEYEKMVTEKERNETLNNFRKVIDERGYSLNEERFSSKCENYDNATLKSFADMIESLDRKPPILSGGTPADPENLSRRINQKTLTFTDVINK